MREKKERVDEREIYRRAVEDSIARLNANKDMVENFLSMCSYSDEPCLNNFVCRDSLRCPSVALSPCGFDGEPCPYNGACQVFAFGVMAKDGKEEVVWSCPRFKKGKKRG